MIADYILSFINDRRSYCSARTVEYYIENLSGFNNYLLQNDVQELKQLNDNVLRDYILYLRSQHIKNTSVNTYFRAVKAFIKYLYNRNLIIEDYTINLKLPRSDAELIQPLTNSEVTSCDRYFINTSQNALRDYCIFHLMLDCGLRRSEVINLAPQDIQNNMLHIRQSKYNKSRLVLLPEFLKRSIKNYVGADEQRNYLFLDRYNEKVITISTIKKLFYSLKAETKIKRLHPHLLRHTFATSYLYYGGNLEMLRLLLGHSDYNVTKTYLHLSAQEQLINTDLYKLDSIFFERR